MALAESMQDAVHSLDQGAAARGLRLFVWSSLALLAGALYAAAQFRGLREPAAMEAAQLARNLSAGAGFRTHCLRPVDARRTDGFDLDAAGTVPEPRLAPGHPWLLSAAFRLLRPSFAVPMDGTLYPPERGVVVPLGVLLTVCAAVAVFVLGRRLFGSEAGLTAAALYLLSDSVLADAISGTERPLAALLLSASACIAVAAVQRRERSQPGAWVLLLIGGALCGAAGLTRYALVLAAPFLALFTGLRFARGKWAAGGVFLLGAVLLWAPWLVRHRAAGTGGPATAALSAMAEDGLYEGDAFERTPQPELSTRHLLRSLRPKAMRKLVRLYDVDLRLMGTGLLACFFLVSLFVPLDEPDAARLRWCLTGALGALLAAAALGGAYTVTALAALLPAVVVFATGFFYILLDRLALPGPAVRALLTSVLILLTALPAVLRVVGGGAGVPYPPYYPPFVAAACDVLQPGGAVCTDIPWATAWYGRRTSLLLPDAPATLATMRADGLAVAGLYLTTQTGDRRYTSDLRSGRFNAWLPVLQRRVPAELPFTNGIALPPGSLDQLVLTGRFRPAPRGGTTSAPSPSAADAP